MSNKDTEARTSKSVDQKYWFNLAVENFIIQGKSERTAKTYARDLKILVKYYNKPLNQLTEDEIRKYVVYRQIDCGLQPTSMRILYCGLKFLFCEVLDMDYPIFEVMKAKRERRLPDVLTRGEVIKVLNHISTFYCYVFFRTLYSCGLRLFEALNLRIQDIDGKRMRLKINGKGSKDRYVPLPEATYELLRLYWKTHKNEKLIFPALGRKLTKAPTAETPMSMSSVTSAVNSRLFTVPVAIATVRYASIIAMRNGLING